jgi:hypothetical protein
MATNTSRSMNTDLGLGMTEGKYQTVSPDRGGEVDRATARARKDLFRGPGGYNISVPPTMTRPDDGRA